MITADRYKEWARLRNWELGPVFLYSESGSARWERLHGELWETLGPVEPAAEDPRLFCLDSPWDAAFFLACLQHESVVGRNTHLLFRGQTRSAWDLTPTIDRLSDAEKINRALSESWIFCQLMTRLKTGVIQLSGAPGTSFDLILPVESYMPVAQHYGLKTPLLDFTADPAVAVYFASRHEQDAAGEFASAFVYQMPLKNDDRHLLNLRLPPPFIARPYLQKGIYLESVVPGDIGRQVPWDFEIKFPVRAGNSGFTVVREAEVSLLPESAEISILRAYAISGVAEFRIENAGQVFTTELLSEFAKRYARAHENKLQALFKEHVVFPDYLYQYIANVEDMLYWLCYCPQENGFAINQDSFEAIVRGNPEIFRMLIGYYRRFMNGSVAGISLSDSQRDTKRKIVELVEQILTDMGKDPMSAPDLASLFNT